MTDQTTIMLAALVARVDAINAGVAGMVADNKTREMLDQAMAYDGKCFADSEVEISTIADQMAALADDAKPKSMPSGTHVECNGITAYVITEHEHNVICHGLSKPGEFSFQKSKCKVISNKLKPTSDPPSDAHPATDDGMAGAIAVEAIAAKLLDIAREVFGNHGCNDVEDSFWEVWTDKQRADFCRSYHEWNGDPESFDSRFLHIPDFALMAYVSDLLKDDPGWIAVGDELPELLQIIEAKWGEGGETEDAVYDEDGDWSQTTLLGGVIRKSPSHWRPITKEEGQENEG